MWVGDRGTVKGQKKRTFRSHDKNIHLSTWRAFSASVVWPIKHLCPGQAQFATVQLVPRIDHRLSISQAQRK